ncbi:MAG: SEL1-like repeat protein [Desulfobacteraceae bacterium]|nr:SEL1-like repeat protein [Desulfobacteraceae bacterium]
MSRVRTISLLLLFSFMLTIGCAIKYNKISTLPAKNQSSFFKDGRQVIVSQKPNSIVTIAASQGSFPVNTRPSFIIVVNNVSPQPVTFSTEDVVFSMEGKELKVFSFQELVQEIQQQRRSAATTQALIGALGILGASMQGGRTYHSGTYQSQNTVGTYSGTTYSPLATLQAQTTFGALTANNIAAINSAAEKQLSSVQNTILKKQTVLPNTWYGGYVRIDNMPEPEAPKSIKSTITVGKDIHEFLFTLAQQVQGLQKTQRIKGETVSDDRIPTSLKTKISKEVSDAKKAEQQPPISEVSRLQFENYRQAAEQGIAKAQFQLALMYFNGSGVSKNHIEAATWFRKAAEQGYVIAQYNLAVMYLKGYGVQQDYVEAAKWLEKAAEQGYVAAQYDLGVSYDKGAGVPRDYIQAEKWYRKAAERGNPSAQFNLGFMYFEGQRVPQDLVEAEKLFRKAAEQGHAKAQFWLGLVLINFSSDTAYNAHVEAGKWFRKAADQGDVRCEYNLGLMYKKGKGVPQNYVEAANWFRKAAVKGYLFAQCALGNLLVASVYPEWDHVAYSDTDNVFVHPGKLRRNGNLVYFWEMWVPFKVSQSTIKEKKDYYVGDCAKGKTGLVSFYEYGFNNKLLRSHSRKKSEIRMEPVVPGSIGDAILKYVCSKANNAPKKKKSMDKVVSFGTGWPVVAGFVVANNHVISGHSKISLIRTDGTRIPATVALRDKSNDLALLQVEDVKFLPLALPLSSIPARIGAKVITMGYPHPDILGSKPKLTEGVVSATSGAGDDPRVLQISVPVQAGNSGGPLINMKGEVVGVVMAKLNAVKIFKWTGDLPQNVNYAIKIPYLTGLISSVPVNHAVKMLNMKKVNSIEDIAAQIRDSILLVVAE